MESDQHIGKVVGVIAVMLLLRSAALAEIQGGAAGEPSSRVLKTGVSTLRQAQGERKSAMKSRRASALLSLPKDEPVEALGGVFQRPATGAAATALALCCEADQLSGADRQRVLMRGLALAKNAAATDPSDAQAHFAVFCNLGKQVQSGTLGLRDLTAIGQLRHELDTALALAPDDGGALTAEGAMLLALPWFLGGDVRRSEELLRRVLVKDPTNAAARRYLSEALRARGADDEAHALEMLDLPTAAPEAACTRSARDVALPLDGSVSCRDVRPKHCAKNGGTAE